jgi:hypothetical protein
MNKLQWILLLFFILQIQGCKDELPTTGTLIVILPGFPNQELRLFDPASVTTSVNVNDALFVGVFDSDGKSTFSDINAGNYIILFNNLRKGAQVKAGETVTVNL